MQLTLRVLGIVLWAALWLPATLTGVQETGRTGTDQLRRNERIHPAYAAHPRANGVFVGPSRVGGLLSWLSRRSGTEARLGHPPIAPIRQLRAFAPHAAGTEPTALHGWRKAARAGTQPRAPCPA